MANIIVTGGSGFLGKHLCRALAAASHTVKNIDLRENSEFPTVIADVQDQAAMLEHIKDAELVLHLASLIEAGESVKFPQKFVDVNISGTVNVLEAMRQNNVPIFIFSSSAAVYGEPIRVPIQEDDRTMPINPYGMTKLAMEALVSSYVASFGLTGVALRYFNLYGPEEHHQPETHAIPRFIEQISNDQPVTVWGNGEHQRDFIHVADVVAAHLRAYEYAKAHPKTYGYFNISAESPMEVRQIIQMLENIIGKSAQIQQNPPRPGDPLVLVASAAKAREQLGWKAEVDIESGLRQTVEYFLKR